MLLKEAQKFPEILEKCKTAEKATDNDYMNLKMNVKPKTKAMNCLGTCISEKLGWVSHFYSSQSNVYIISVKNLTVKNYHIS